MKVRIELVGNDGRIYVGECALTEAKSDKKSPIIPASAQTISATLPQRILALREKGFFSGPRVSPEVFEEIKKTYYCQSDRVVMALIRLQKNKQLRKATKLYNGKKMNAYVW